MKRFTVKPEKKGEKVDAGKVIKGQQGVKVGVQGKDDEEFWQEAGAKKGGKSQ